MTWPMSFAGFVLHTVLLLTFYTEWQVKRAEEVCSHLEHSAA